MKLLADGIQAEGLPLIGWATSEPKDREDLIREMSDLANTPSEQWPADKVRPFNGHPSVYILHPNQNLRVVFRQEKPGLMTILDITQQEWVDNFLRTKPQEVG